MEPVRLVKDDAPKYVSTESALRAIVVAFALGMLLGAAVGIIGVTLGVYDALENSRE
jgi:hypothetical protein